MTSAMQDLLRNTSRHFVHVLDKSTLLQRQVYNFNMMMMMMMIIIMIKMMVMMMVVIVMMMMTMMMMMVLLMMIEMMMLCIDNVLVSYTSSLSLLHYHLRPTFHL